jgi:hypothetical protein
LASMSTVAEQRRRRCVELRLAQLRARRSS